MADCPHHPYPGNGAYGHWQCQRDRWHLGRHRYVNYTTPRFPRVWRVRPLRLFRLWRRLGFTTSEHRRKAVADSVRRRIRPSRYDPITDLRPWNIDAEEVPR